MAPPMTDMQRGCEKGGLAPSQLPRKPDKYISYQGACPNFFTAFQKFQFSVHRELTGLTETTVLVPGKGEGEAWGNKKQYLRAINFPANWTTLMSLGMVMDESLVHG